MKKILPISHLICEKNVYEIDKISAYEYKEIRPIFTNDAPLFFHSGLGIVQKEFFPFFGAIEKYLSDNDFEMFSFDLGPASKTVVVKDYYYVHRTQILDREHIKKTIRDRLTILKRKFRGKIALENLNYYPSKAYLHVCESDFISEVVNENDVYFLLDLAHAQISAYNLGLDLMDYVKCLPLDRVIEIHISRPKRIDDIFYDCHEVPCLYDYEILNKVYQLCPLSPYIAIEYYKNFNLLKNSYDHLN